MLDIDTTTERIESKDDMERIVAKTIQDSA
jgi:hypothetical protein